MPVGPGKYDGWCTRVREGTHADGVVLIILGGDEGSGFSVQAPLTAQVHLPQMLEEMAKQIRASLVRGAL